MILEGLGDQAQVVLGGRTPLQVARTPNLDHLALLGGGGLYHPYKTGAALFSELSLFLSLGYPLEEFPGRGVLGAKAAGISMEQNEVFLLASLASLESYLGASILVEKIENLSPEEWTEMATLLARPWCDSEVEIIFKPLERGVGILKCKGRVSPRVSDSNPSHRGATICEIVPLDPSEDAMRLANALNAYIEEMCDALVRLPLNERRGREGRTIINALLTQGAGQVKKVPTLKEKWGLTGAIISSDPLIKGLGLELSMETETISEGNPTEEMLEKLRKAMELSERFDLVAIHTRAPKVATRRHNPWGKVRAVEEIDHALSYLLEQLIPREDILLIIWGGQSTSSSGPYLYSGEPSPIIFLGSRVRKGACFRFDESSLSYGSLGLLKGDELILSALTYTGRAPLMGRARGTPF